MSVVPPVVTNYRYVATVTGMVRCWAVRAKMVKCRHIGATVLARPHDGDEVLLDAKGNSVRCCFGAKGSHLHTPKLTPG
jgi:hypothetical protein